MLSPTHPVRYFISYNGRKALRTVQDALHASGFARSSCATALPVSIKSEQSPIFRNFRNVRRELFINKITNLKLALAHINGIVIEPGKTFSFWNLVGKPGANKGYLPGLVIERGMPREGVGGGLCQLANMIHWLALHSDLEVTERHRHSFDIFPDDHRSVPFGTGATVVYNYKDLRLMNNTEQTYQLRFDLNDEMLTGELRSDSEQNRAYHVEEREHAFIQTDSGLYRKNKVFQIVADRESGHTKERLVFNNYCLCRYSIDEVSL